MSNSKTFLTFLFLCVAAMCCSPELGAQESLKSQIVTEYDGKPYYIHTVDKKQSLKDIADMYDVTIYEILKENKDVKYNVKAGELLRIPYRPKEEVTFMEEVAIDSIMANDSTKYVEEYILPAFDSERLYKVALMMPLYLEQVDDAFMEAEVSNKQLLAKPFSYLHFYEGFMIAVDSMVSQYDMKLDLKVYDVDQDTNKVIAAINDTWLSNADVIVGPFHVKAFEKVM
ncbi:MAG: LysM peptidoglycan-binding domain-containing protein, partial [Bacteroidales bacterium]|nr:LysM peptidoglycan-binding domain-containing protein [Bacteroidales bacterium]